jgi:hypothetical protein
MTIVEEITRRAMDYVRGGMDARAAVRRACAEQVRSGVGDFAANWDTVTSLIPWVLAGVAGIAIYRGAVKAKTAASDFIAEKRRKFSAAKAAWDAVL